MFRFHLRWNDKKENTTMSYDRKRRKISFAFVIILGLVLGMLIKRVQVGLIIGLVIGLMASTLGSSRR
jgi:F0F1-type ATP synthase assembly protein I